MDAAVSLPKNDTSLSSIAKVVVDAARGVDVVTTVVVVALVVDEGFPSVGSRCMGRDILIRNVYSRSLSILFLQLDGP